MESTTIAVPDIALFKQQALHWANQFNTFACLDSNDYKQDVYSELEFVLAVDALTEVVEQPNSHSFERLQAFISQQSAWYFGYLSYDLKNEVEVLTSNHEDHIALPAMYFFQPRYIFQLKGNKVIVNRNYPETFALLEQIMSLPKPKSVEQAQINLSSRMSKEAYIEAVENIKDDIRAGDVYEMNLCRELYAEAVEINPVALFEALNKKTKAPFSSLFKTNNRYLVSASPERFLKKKGQQLISQPIKGTIKRSAEYEEDEFLKSSLYFNEKERAENVMIVDLVRNDLTKHAVPASIKVKKLFEVKTFETVHHLISSIEATLQANVDMVSPIRDAFPMGSMTGAPKVKAMELIEKYERTKRGLFSGSIGYFTPEQDFDFNVVIRSYLYNASTKYLSIQSGGAITIDSDPIAEWDELNLKSNALVEILNQYTHGNS